LKSRISKNSPLFSLGNTVKKTIYPKKEDVFSCFGYTDYDDLKVVILGQDPYHQPNQAHGMCFSVKPKTPFPPSLQNIFKEYSNDLNLPYPEVGYLVPWAREGVLLLNAVLTVEEGKPNSHQNKGWEVFTDEVLKRCNQHPLPVVFILWGRNAQMKEPLITQKTSFDTQSSASLTVISLSRILWFASVYKVQ
jgi:uracil-DNA glycosylase